MVLNICQMLQIVCMHLYIYNYQKVDHYLTTDATKFIICVFVLEDELQWNLG